MINAYQESGYEALTDEAKAQLLHLQSQSTDWGKIFSCLNQEYNVSQEVVKKLLITTTGFKSTKTGDTCIQISSVLYAVFE